MSASVIRAASRRPVLITGGAGFIGANLAHRLLQSGRQVRIYDNLSRSGAEQNLRRLKAAYGSRLQMRLADIRSAKELGSALTDVGTVFHLAAQVAVTNSLVDPREDFAINAEGTLNLLEAVRGHDIGVIFTSTNKVYGSLEDVPLVASSSRYRPIDEIQALDETRPLSFHSPYGCSKGTADQYILDYARGYRVNAAVFRMSCVYGPCQYGTEDQGWVAHFMIRAVCSLPITIYGDGKQVRDLLYVNDLIEALLCAEERLPEIAGEAFNIGGGPGNTISLLELIEHIATLQGCRPEVVLGP
jgi:CDP-paratose 2-epimerase